MTALRCEGRWCETPTDNVVLIVGKVSSLPLCRSCRDAFDAVSQFVQGIPTWENSPEAQEDARRRLEELQEKNERFRRAYDPPVSDSGRPMPQMRRYRKGTASRPLEQ